MENARSDDAGANVFSYRSHKDSTVRVAFRGKVVATLSAKDAVRFLSRIEGADETVRRNC